MAELYRQTREVLGAIKFQHSIFALPFALTGALVAVRASGQDAAELGWRLLWITVAMVAARSAAMTFNRIADASFDGRNPRTATRAVPAGRLSRRFAGAFVLGCCATFLYAAGQLNPLCLKLSPFALALVLGYSYTKRFTVLSHLVLGAALGLAPAAAWIAVRGSLDASILPLSAAVMLWVAGFDIIYACQDVAFDRETGLHSMPARYGVAAALRFSRLLHLGMVALLLVAWRSLELGPLALASVGIVAALLIYEHSLVRANDLTRVDAAFFLANGWLSVLFFAFWAGDLWLGGGLP